MKREKFIKYAEREIDNAFREQKNRMMNLVEKAWAEGKRNAEIDGVASIVKGILEKTNDKKNDADNQKAEDRKFTPREVEEELVLHGQGDERFGFMETIKYSPSEVRKILTGDM